MQPLFLLFIYIWLSRSTYFHVINPEAEVWAWKSMSIVSTNINRARDRALRFASRRVPKMPRVQTPWWKRIANIHQQCLSWEARFLCCLSFLSFEFLSSRRLQDNVFVRIQYSTRWLALAWISQQVWIVKWWKLYLDKPVNHVRLIHKPYINIDASLLQQISSLFLRCSKAERI